MTDPTPIIMFGAAGRMGRTILECAAAEPKQFTIAGALDSASHPAVGQPLRAFVADAPESVTIESDFPDAPPAGAVVINFSLPEPSMAQLEWALEKGVASVVGTTGFTDEQLARIQEIGAKIPLIVAPNMSVGVNVLYELVSSAVKVLGDAYDVEITEMHHRFKKDAPSGTARRLLEVVQEAKGEGNSGPVHHGREGIVGERTANEIGMHCIRGGDVVGDHTVTLATLGERIELTHRAGSRETFARGALRAARWISGKAPGLYSIKDVLGIE